MEEHEGKRIHEGSRRKINSTGHRTTSKIIWITRNEGKQIGNTSTDQTPAS